MQKLDFCPIDDCDVFDREKLMQYRDKAQSWHELLVGDEEHSVFGQYTNMMWQDAAWRMANEARRFTFDDGPTSAINPILGKLIDHGYAMGQVIALSRLMEQPIPGQPKKAVVSIRRIVDELCANRELFTREVFVSHNGLCYDWQTSSHSTVSNRVEWVEPTGSNGYLISLLKHEQFDKLSGVDACSRSRDDRLPDSIFDRLQDKLNDAVFDEIKYLRNKRIAHAADAYSRNQVQNLRQSLKFEELEKAHYILTGVIQTVAVALLFGHRIGTSVPREQPNAFEHFEKPFIQPSRMREFYQFWCAHSQEREDWLTKAYHDTLPELAK
jgi:hypothetical protein